MDCCLHFEDWISGGWLGWRAKLFGMAGIGQFPYQQGAFLPTRPDLLGQKTHACLVFITDPMPLPMEVQGR